MFDYFTFPRPPPMVDTSSRIVTAFEHLMIDIGDTPNHESHSALTETLNADIEVGQHVQSLDEIEPSVPQPSPCLGHAQHANGLPDSFATADSHEQPWQLLIDPTIPQDELPSLIEAIFSDRKAADMVDPLQESDAQAIIDVIDEVRHQVPDLGN